MKNTRSFFEVGQVWTRNIMILRKFQAKKASKKTDKLGEIDLFLANLENWASPFSTFMKYKIDYGKSNRNIKLR